MIGAGSGGIGKRSGFDVRHQAGDAPTRHTGTTFHDYCVVERLCGPQHRQSHCRIRPTLCGKINNWFAGCKSLPTSTKITLLPAGREMRQRAGQSGEGRMKGVDDGDSLFNRRI